MHIQGVQKLTLLDYPGHIACTLFSYGCNLRCPFCHNSSLVIDSPSDNVNDEELELFLKKRKGILEGICLSGGEPLVNSDVIGFLEYLKTFGCKIKLDTNGFYPEKLKNIIEKGLVDYVAVDIKASKENYSNATGIKNTDVKPLCESIDILMSSQVDYEFRTTAVNGLHNVGEFEDIAFWIKDAKQYFIQQFVSSENVISSSFKPFSLTEMNEILFTVQKIIPHAGLRGI